MNLSVQGNFGLGKAINYFTTHNITVSIPLNDTQSYDLVADINGKLCKISVKTSRNIGRNGKYEVLLRSASSTRTKCKIIKFDNQSCDYVFIYTSDNKMYLIPSNEIKIHHTLTITDKCAKYEVFDGNIDLLMKHSVGA